jgi:coniferyl-aldehyde dehydrogenase
MAFAASMNGPSCEIGIADVLLRTLALQTREQTYSGPPSARLRRDRIDRTIALLVENKERLSTAISADFGVRSPLVNLLTDVGGSIAALKYARANLGAWMRPEKRHTTPSVLGLLGAKAWVQYQPKGVVGVISPWNFPVNLTFGPLAGILAA